jgi:hypothetical protein
MAKFTFLEINLDGAQLTANAPFSDGSEHPDAIPGDADEGAATADDDSSGTRPWLAAFIGLLFLVVVAVLAKKRFGGANESGVAPEEPALDG